MKTSRELQALLRRLDSKGYKAYKGIKGTYDFQSFHVRIDHVQGDPFATPSRVRVLFEHDYPPYTYSNKSREIAMCDFLTRQFAGAIRAHTRGNRGTGKSGLIGIDEPGQEILERTSVVLDHGRAEVRFVMGLPAFGRRIAGRHAIEMFMDELPRIVEGSVFFSAIDEAVLKEHLEICEDADALRSKLEGLGLVAFVADGASLPRKSGIDPQPLPGAIPFASPEELRVEVELPNRTVTGMGVPKGITLIVGGGYHGKSTLLTAIQLGVYNHIPGDGREFVVSVPGAMKIRAEDGRNIVKVDISPFIAELPQKTDTGAFSTENASGSTSQAANIIEALEAGARVLLIDEDTSATNFMIRDERMQRLVPKSREPITPYIDKARQLFDEHGVSTILVLGGSGAYFDIADTVICMIEYLPKDMTAAAHAIVNEYPSTRVIEGGDTFGRVTQRMPDPGSINPQKGKRSKIKALGMNGIQFGRSTIEISALEQLVSTSQTRAIGLAIEYSKKYMSQRTVEEVLDLVLKDIENGSLDTLTNYPVGDLAVFRRLELAAAMNRLRTLTVEQQR